MRIRARPLAVCSMLACVLLVSPGLAQPLPSGASPQDFRTITDPKGRFTIDMPTSWGVFSLDAAVRELASSPTAKMVPNGVMLSGVVGGANIGDRETPGPTVFIAALRLPPEISPIDFVARLRSAGAPSNSGATAQGARIIKAAPMTLSGRDAYYAYMTLTRRSTQDLYQVVVFFPGSDALILIGGMTQNQPGRVRTDIPLIVRVINTFHALN